MPYSTLFRRAAAPVVQWQDAGGQPQTTPDPNFMVVSQPLADTTLVIHGAPGVPIPGDALQTYFDGSAPWTWLQFSVGPSALTLRPKCFPHEWVGEPSALGITPLQFPLLTPVAGVAG